MHTRSFLAGLLTGVLLAILAVVASEPGVYVGEHEPPAYAAFRDASGLTAGTVLELPEGQRIGADRREWKPLR